MIESTSGSLSKTEVHSRPAAIDGSARSRIAISVYVAGAGVLVAALGAFAIGRSRSGETAPAVAGPPTNFGAPRHVRRPSDRASLAAALASQGADGGAQAARPTDPVSERDDMLRRLQASGADGSAWTTDARAVFAKWQATSTAAANTRVSEVSCFAMGCSTTMLFADRASFGDVSHDFQESGQFRSWTGGKYRSAPLPQPSGGFAATWVLFRPETSTP